eukprot:1782938-Amphidinium_carterae.1
MTHACPHSAAEIGRTAAQLMALEEAEARCRTGQAKQLNQSQRPLPQINKDSPQENQRTRLKNTTQNI